MATKINDGFNIDGFGEFYDDYGIANDGSTIQRIKRSMWLHDLIKDGIRSDDEGTVFLPCLDRALCLVTYLKVYLLNL